jgi:hypothetical protein
MRLFTERQLKRLKEEEALLVERVNTLENMISRLTTTKFNLTDTVEELKVKNKRLQQTKVMEEEQVAHKLAMREGASDLNYKTKLHDGLAKKETEKNTAIAKVKDDFQNKLTAQLVTRGDELKEMYVEILARLPTIKVTGKLGAK